MKAKIIGMVSHQIPEKTLKIKKEFYYKTSQLVNEYGEVFGTEYVIAAKDYIEAKSILDPPGEYSDVWNQTRCYQAGITLAEAAKLGWEKDYYYIWS